MEALHHIADLRRNRSSRSHADAETEQIAHEAAAASAGGDGRAHVADGLGIGFLHLGLKHILLTVALGGHDLGLGETGKPLGLCLGLGSNDPSLGFAPGDFCFRGLLLQNSLAMGSLYGGCALLLHGAELCLALGLGGLDCGLCLNHASLERDGM